MRTFRTTYECRTCEYGPCQASSTSDVVKAFKCPFFFAVETKPSFKQVATVADFEIIEDD